MDLEQRIAKIEERNHRVELEKAWEVSKTRVVLILTITYIVAAGTFLVIGSDNPWRNALVPVVGYFLSTLSIPAAKRLWTKHRENSD